MKIAFRIALVYLGILVIVGFAQGKTIYVDDDAAPGGNGSSTYPFQRIQDGINAANEETSDVVQVANGLYKGVGNVNLDFGGKAITVKSENGAQNCIIDCENVDPTHGFIFQSQEGPDSVVDGFTIRNARTTEDWPLGCGGGFVCSDHSSPTIINNIITDNWVRYSGGGIYCTYASHAVIMNNRITGNSGQVGGGIRCGASSPTITGNLISGNYSTECGAGIACTHRSYPIITDNVITNNSANEEAGGIFCHIASPIIKNNLIAGNSANWNGGGIFLQYESSPDIINNTIIQNSAGWDGGAFYCHNDSHPVVVNTIIWDNSPQEIYFGSVPATAHVAIMGYGDDNFPNTITISYSDVKGGLAAIETNDNGTVDWGDGNIDVAPLFRELAMGNYRLSDFSLCIGAGVMTLDVPTTDIEGTARPTPPGSDPDIGAYESSRAEPGYIDLTSPDGGEVWSRGSSHDITWTSAGPGIDHVRIMYSTDSGSNYPYTIISSTPNDGVYEWTVPLLNSTTVRVKVIAEDSSNNELTSDASNADFTIDITPIVIYVPDNYGTIQPAIDASLDGDTVMVRDETYTGPGNVDLDFGGRAITVRSENGPEGCIIDCQNISGTRGFYFHSGEGADSIVEGFTIRRGVAAGSWPDYAGGGIYCSSSSPTIRGNIIIENSADLGGGIWCYYSSPAIEGNIIAGNTASSSQTSADGGGIHFRYSSSTLKNNVITGNTSNLGGGFYCAYNSSLTVISNTIADNVSNIGGTYYRENSSAALVNTILWNASPQEVWFSGSGSPNSISISYSDIKGGQSGIVTNSNGTVSWGAGNIDEGPLFASYSLSDFSPCIGAGVMTPGVPTTDIGEVARPTPSGSNPDMGAYENSRSEPGYMDLTSPDGGEVWRGGASHDITWTSAGSGIDHIHIVYSTDSGITYPHTIIPNTPNDGIYEWSVSMENSITVRVKVIAENSSSNELISDASNANLTIDSIAPETVISPPDGTPGENGWYLSDVTITLSATDNLSGVKEIKYKIDDGIWQIYPAGGITVTGSNVFYYRAEDNAGNLESEKSIEVKIDKTPPPDPIVVDDGVYTNSTTQLHAWWVSDDPESGIEKYEYAVGTTQGGDDVVGWTSIGETVSGISMNMPEGSILSGGSMIDLASVDGEVTVTGLSLVDDQIYYFSVRAKNNAGLWSGDGYSDGITVDVDLEQKELHLYPGWNLISLCLNTGDNTLSSVLQPISGLYRSVWFYDAASGNWRRYVPDGPALPGDLNSMETGEGYWIDMVEDATLTITGQEITSMSVQLYPGWNMVGYSLSNDQSLGTALVSIADKYNCILTYDGMTGSWSGYIPGVPVPPNSLDHLESCSGYWISAKENCLWNVGL